MTEQQPCGVTYEAAGLRSSFLRPPAGPAPMLEGRDSTPSRDERVNQ